MQEHRWTVAVALALLATVSRVAMAQVDVTTCGQSVPSGQVGSLVADLDCSAWTGDGVVLQDGATLDLHGFALTGNSSLPFNTAHGVRCPGRCSILGPGAVQGFAGDGVFAEGLVQLTGAAVLNNAHHGIEGDAFTKVIVTDGILYRNGSIGVSTGGNVVVTGSTFYWNDEGISGLNVTARDSTFTLNGVAGINAVGKARINGCTFTDNVEVGIQVQRASVLGSALSGNGTGISGRKILVRGTSVKDSLYDGIDAVTARVRDSLVTGSGSACNPPTFPCADIATQERPVVVNTTCNSSLAWQTKQSWGVCPGE